MFRVVDFPAEGPPIERGATDALERPPAGTIRWIDLLGPDEAQLARLAGPFGLHPLAVEDCLHVDQRAKLEEYDGHIFLVMHGFSIQGDDPCTLGLEELHAFLGPGWLITVHDRPVPELDAVLRRALADPALGRRGADFVYYLVADALVDGNFGHLDRISDALEDLEERVLVRPDSALMQRLFHVKHTLVQMRRVLSPQRDVFAILAKRGAAVVGERTGPYFRDVYDHLVRIGESIDSARDVLGNVLEAYLSMVAQRTNDVMKQLTVLSAVFLPLTFITGFFGQNFDDLPHTSHWLPWAVTGLCLATPIGMLAWFRWRRWL